MSIVNEADSKRLLADYGVPVVEERRASDATEAVRLADEIGFPVVLKALGSRISHKTERGLVRLDLTQPGDVEQSAREIAAAAGEDLEGYLIQPMLAGRREMVAGLFHDSQFGPVVMFGLGGVFTEALHDVVFALAPLDESEAAHMLDQLVSRKLLEDFRGEAAADRNALVQTLTGLSRLSQERPDVVEVDINPLLINPQGQIVAVDALVVTGERRQLGLDRAPVAPSDVGKIFHPRSVAIVGASATFGKWGNMLLASIVAGGFEGELYLVNPRGGEIAGRRAHRTVLDIPNPVDLAVITVPAHRVQGLLPELQAKGINKAVLISSGFAEFGERGKRLEEDLVEEARARGILFLGPNTMGVCNPYRAFYCTGAISRPEPGPTAFMSQSGNMGVQLLTFAERQGIGIRAFGGTGNEAMVTIEDVLDAFAVDELSRTVLLYIESVKNGRRFFNSARNVSRQKPIVVLKGGRTDAGGAAAASHTGALASDQRVFSAACRQSGIVMAEQPIDMLDLAAAFSSLPLPPGNRVAIMTLGGGWGVVTADLCAEHGLEVPELPAAMIGQINQLLPDYWSRGNPVDLVGDNDPEMPLKVIESLLAWDGVDAAIHLGVVGRKWMLRQVTDAWKTVDPTVDPGTISKINEIVDQAEVRFIQHLTGLMEQYGKPVLGVGLVEGENSKTVIEVPGRPFKAVLFSSPERTVKSLSRMCEYRSWRRRQGLD
jgi:acyl-CoA synthetase (NDP forming)